MENHSSDALNETLSEVPLPYACLAWLPFLGLVGAVTVAINALAIIVYLKEQNLRKRTMYLIMSQAVADMCVGGISLPIDVSNSGFYCRLWKINPSPKGIWPSILIAVLFVFNMASVINLAAISLERTHATFRPFQHRLLSKWIFGAAVAAVWITAVLSASYIYLDLFFALSGPGEFYSYLSILAFCFFVIAVSYASIVAKMLCGTLPQHQRAISRERKLTKTLFLVTLASYMLLSPYIICFFLIFSKRTFFSFSSQTLHLYFLLVSLAYVNSMVNPILYTLRIPEFKRALVSLLAFRSGRQISLQSDS